MSYETLDSGNRREFTTGAVRDVCEDKPRYKLIPVRPLRRLAELMGRGAKKYGERNWEKGMPLSDCYDSAMRHLQQWAEGEGEEDHLAAVAFNIFAIMEYEARVECHQLPTELADMGPLTRATQNRSR